MKKIIVFIIMLQFVTINMFAQNCNQGNQDENKPPKETPDENPSAKANIPVLASRDPNEIIGTKGYDALGDTMQWVSATEALPYTIFFENDPVLATAAAHKVSVRHKLHAKANRATFSVGAFGFNNMVFAVEGGPSSYQTRIDLADSLGIYVDVVAGYDVVTNEAFWILQTIDPTTGLPPTGINDGFLPINDTTHCGEGYVSFTIKPNEYQCVTGDTITAMASIVFDVNDAIPTNRWINTIDALSPTTQLVGSELDGGTLLFQFTGSDDEGGCGIKQYKLYASDNYGAYQLYGTYPVGEEATYETEYGHNYRFFCLGEDNVGNTETMKEEPEYEYGNYNLIVSVEPSPDNGGEVSGGGYFVLGENATVVATPYYGYIFDRWSYNGMTVSTDSIYTFPVEGHRELVASFLFDGTMYVQNDCLTDGWNWWSSRIAMNTSGDFGRVKNALGSEGLTIKSQNDGFVSYFVDDWYGNLFELNNNEMFMIEMNAERNISVSGILVNGNDIPITLDNGWTWIGYPINESLTVNDALSNLTPTMNDIIKSRDDFATYYPGIGWIGTLSTLTPGMGYMYESNADEPITFNYSNSRIDEVTENKHRDYHWEADVKHYSDNATLIGWVVVDGVEMRKESMEVGAFVNDVCVGHANLSYVEPFDRYLLFMNYYGNEGDTISFQLYDEDLYYEYGTANNEIVFASNSMIGSLDNPYLISFGYLNVFENAAGSVVMYPNPVETNNTLKIRLVNNDMEDNEARLDVFNSIGTIVYTKNLYEFNSLEMQAPSVSGMYIIKITFKNGNVYYGKLSVE